MIGVKKENQIIEDKSQENCSTSEPSEVVVLENFISPILDFRAVTPPRQKHKFEYELNTDKGNQFI